MIMQVPEVADDEQVAQVMNSGGDQMLFEDGPLVQDFGLRERDRLLKPAGRDYRLTKSDRAALVTIAADSAGGRATFDQVNDALREKINGMFRAFSTDEVLSAAIAVSPCRAFAVIPLGERAFYQFVNPRLSPSVRGVFLWETFHERFLEQRYVMVHRYSRLLERPWWAQSCRMLIVRTRAGLERFDRLWSSFGLTGSDVGPLVELFPRPGDNTRVRIPDEMVLGIDQAEG
jgi:hypothetical protein